MTTSTSTPTQAPVPAPTPHGASVSMAPVPVPSALVRPAAPPPSEAPPPTDAPATSQPEKSRDQRRATRPLYDDVYITRFGFEINYIHVLKDARLDATVGKYHTQPQGDDWIVEALLEATRLCRTRSVIRIHTTETELADTLRGFRQQDSARFSELRRVLGSSGKSFQLARPERETPMWRELMRLMKGGQMLTPSPLVTYMVHTAAITDYEQVYCGVVMVGLGSIVVHARKSDGDDLVDAELEMMQWVIENAGGGGRIDVHHASDGARRIWEQAAHLASQTGSDDLGRAGSRLRALMREALRVRTTISPARAPNEILDRFAKAAAATCWIGTNVL
ncbi:hypothetical protein [Deinococcus ruber]|uniref:Uncharacterized protein n=1 Tax=Deinococcus ruber TaxID=1848197 RepID=A0A918CDE7_9DEIO|nr:hypothetical protein [Deinococcus ruber]GGR15348.1 hypothetical protein GCM10008957_30110 [Deinococcus ruber]